MKKSIVILVLIYIFCLVSCSDNSRVIDIYKENTHSVVELKCSYNDNDAFGTAVCIDKDGYFITNAHVINFIKAGNETLFDSYSIRYSFENDYREVNLVSYDTKLDLALLKTDDKIYSPMSLGSVDNIKIGDVVYTLGNSQNQGLSLAKGIISKTRVNVVLSTRTVVAIASDAYISEGNSGGALISENNKLIGITSFRLKDEFGNTIYGMGYSIPIDIVVEYINSCIG